MSNLCSSFCGQLQYPFASGDNVGIKLHWGEKGNKSFLPPDYAREIAALADRQRSKTISFLIRQCSIPAADAPPKILSRLPRLTATQPNFWDVRLLSPTAWMGGMLFQFPRATNISKPFRWEMCLIRHRVLSSFPISRDTWFLCSAEPSKISPWDLLPARRNSECIPIIIRF